MSIKREIKFNDITLCVTIDKNKNIYDIQPRLRSIYDRLKGRVYSFKILDGRNEEGTNLILDYCERYCL